MPGLRTFVFALSGAAALACAPQSEAENTAAASETESVRPLAQINPWGSAPYNIEEPYLNIIHASRMRWHGDGWKTQDLLDRGVINPHTGIPKVLPDGKWLTSELYMTGNSPAMAMQWDGEWILDWEGDADLWIAHLPRDMQWRTKNRIEFTVDHKRGRTNLVAIQIRRIKGELSNLRLYRKEHAARVEAGELFNPEFVSAIARYDIVRTTDLQSASTALIRSVDELPGPEAPFWGNAAWGSQDRVRHPYRSAPVEAMMALAMEADVALWTTVPITLGNPLDFHDPSVVRPENTYWAGAYRAQSRGRMAEILASEEWDRYADHFVAKLIETGYPEERSLYVTIENEVWNFAFQYFAAVQYAMAIAEGVGPALGHNDGNHRWGYGVVSARWKLALDAALERAGRRQNVIYVIESQAGFIFTTPPALQGAKSWMEAQGETWADHAGGFGVSVASYWGDVSAYEAAKDAKDVETFTNAVAEHLLTGGEKAAGSLQQVLYNFRAHANFAAEYGVKFIGAYEGGSHLYNAEDVPDAYYDAFIWGEDGARVNRAVNDALAAEFPGIILSNYALEGPRDAPWFEGFAGDDNPYKRSWEPYLRPPAAQDQ
ncbi:MAG: hypothetical protein AAFW68_11755 [Pseudomonadota bacterium]